MKRVLGEYGKALLACLTGIAALLLLFHQGAVVDTLTHLKPDNPEVKNELIKQQFRTLEVRKKPEILLRFLEIELGDTFQIKDLIRSVKDADGKDLSSVLECYLENGVKADVNDCITAKELTVYRFRFYVEDSQNLYTEKQCAVVVRNKSGVEDADQFLKEWDLGYSSSDQVKARYYSGTRQDGTVRYILSLEGRGRAKEFNDRMDRPWNAVANKITDVTIASTIQTNDISYWFYGCTKLRQMPQLSGSINKMNFVFYGCSELKTGYIPSYVTEAESAFYNCTSMTACVIDSNRLTIMDHTFFNCKNLRGKLIIGSTPASYENCFAYTASNTGGVQLKVYAANIGCEASVIQMINEELKYSDRGSQIIYKGVAK